MAVRHGPLAAITAFGGRGAHGRQDDAIYRLVTGRRLEHRLIRFCHLGYYSDVPDLMRMSVPCDERAPGAVRQKIRGLSRLGPALADAMLVASELVTNAVRHSLCTEDESLTVRIARDDHLRIAVIDPGASGQSAAIVDRPIELGGLGLKVVEQVAATWGAERRDDGYQVWAELELPN